MTTDSTTDNTQPDSTQPENAGPENGDSAATPPREATPRTWLSRIARRKRMLTHERWSQLDAIARTGISDEDYATTMATLETMARNLGWDEKEADGDPGRHGRQGHGHGRGHHRRDHRGHHRGHHRGCAERATVEA
jgi:hypothetical protein